MRLIARQQGSSRSEGMKKRIRTKREVARNGWRVGSIQDSVNGSLWYPAGFLETGKASTGER